MSEEKQNNNKTNESTTYYLQPYEAQRNEISFLEFWHVLVLYKWLILSTTLCAFTVAMVIALGMMPIYRAEVTLAPVSPEEGGRLSALAGEFGGIASLAGFDTGTTITITNRAIATLKSRTFTDDFIEDKKLLPILFDEIWDAQNNEWLVADTERPPTLRKAYKKFDDMRRISQDKNTGLVTMTLDWKDPNQAALWANELVERFNRHEQQKAIAEAEKNIEYLNNQLIKTSIVEMRLAIYRLIEAQTKEIMLANGRDEYVFEVIDPAVVPEIPIKPNRMLIMTAGFAAGLVLGTVLSFMFWSIQKRPERMSKNEVEN